MDNTHEHDCQQCGAHFDTSEQLERHNQEQHGRQAGSSNLGSSGMSSSSRSVSTRSSSNIGSRQRPVLNRYRDLSSSWLNCEERAAGSVPAALVVY